MSKRALFAVFMCAILLFGLVAVGNATNITKERYDYDTVMEGKRVLAPQYTGKQAPFPIKCWDFEDPNDGWVSGVPGFLWHSTDDFCQTGDSCWWNGMEVIPGYLSSWKQFLDTDTILLPEAGVVVLDFWHKYDFEEMSPPSPPWDAWDVGNVQFSVNGGDFQVAPTTSGHLYNSFNPYAFEYHGQGSMPCFGGIFGSGGNNPSWPLCDATDCTLGVYPENTTIIVRFEFASDPYADGFDGWEGWWIDDIVVTLNGVPIFENYGQFNNPDNMHPSFQIYPGTWTRVTNNWGPDSCTGYPKSPDNSWWCPDMQIVEAEYDYLYSPWITLPDTALVTWVSFWWDAYVPGSSCPGDNALQDYFTFQVRSQANMRWTEMFYDYDRRFENWLNDDPNDTLCQPDGFWTLLEDDSLFNGTAVVPRGPGETVQFRFEWLRNAHPDRPECVPPPPGGCGYYIDDFKLDGLKCYGQNMGIFWRCETCRPIPFSVPVGRTVAVKPMVISEHACRSTDAPAELNADVESPNFYTSTTTIASGFPPDSAFHVVMPDSFTAQSTDTIWTRLTVEALLSGDGQVGDNTLEYQFLVTREMEAYLGYHTRFEGQTATSVDWPFGVGVWFEPMFFDSFMICRVDFIAWDSAAYQLHIFDVDSVGDFQECGAPGSIWLGAKWDSSLVEWSRQAFDFTYYPREWEDTLTVPYWRRMRSGDFFVWIEPQMDTLVPGHSFDTKMIRGGHGFIGHPDSGWVNCKESDHPWLPLGEPDRDPVMRVLIGRQGWIPPPEEEFIRGDYNCDGVVDTTDGLEMLEWIFLGSPWPLCRDAADFNDDGDLWSDDAFSILEFAQGSGPPPPPPYPDCGPDPTPDDLGCVEHFYCMVPREFIRGDYDGDGRLLTNDPLMELQWIFSVPGTPPPLCEDAADYDDNGYALTNDALMALQFIFRVPGAPPPPPPYPDCGLDPTEDELDCRLHAFCMVGEAIAYKPSVSVKGEENRLAVGEVAPVNGVVRVPVDLIVTEAVCGFDISLGYDASSLRFVEVVGGDGYDFYAVDTRQEGVVRIGGVPDIEMTDLMEAGTHRVAEIVFIVEDSEADVELKWEKVEVYGSNVEALSVEWVDGVVKAAGGLPKEFALRQNYPNPFNPTTQIKYDLPVDCHVKLTICNILGQRVSTLVDGKQEAGYKAATWNASSFSSGIYFYRLKAGDFVQTRKMVLLK